MKFFSLIIKYLVPDPYYNWIRIQDHLNPDPDWRKKLVSDPDTDKKENGSSTLIEMILYSSLFSNCWPYFQADIVFHTSFKALQSLNTYVADQILVALRHRYDQRVNRELISMLSFLSDPIGYKPGDRCLEMPDLRKAIEKKCRQLFIEEVH